MIHVNDPNFNEHLFRENFKMHTSTSPQFSMIASLDMARKQAMLEGYKFLSRTLDLAQEIRAPQRLYQMAEIPRFTELKYLPHDAFYCGGKLMPLLDEQDKVNSSLNGRVCADQITP